jgi:hypothetical protein
MKKAFLVCLPLLLSACGGEIGGTPVGPVGPAPVLSYPYNPGLNITEDADPRVPYYGEWTWAAAFQDGTFAKGRMSISKRLAPDELFTNTGGGAAIWCADKSFTCAYDGSTIGLISTVHVTDTTGTSQDLLATVYDGAAKQTRFVMFDEDALINMESGGPTLIGPGRWTNPDGTKADVGMALSQTSADPVIKLASLSAQSVSSALFTPAHFALGTLTTGSTFKTSELQQRALAALRALK